MEPMEIISNPKDLSQAVELYKEIFENTSYDKDSSEIKNDMERIISEGGEILTVKSGEFDLPLALAVIGRDGDTLVIFYAGVKDGFRKQGIWGYLYDFIKYQAQKSGAINLGIENNPELFPEMDKFIKNNHFEEVEKFHLGNNKYSLSYKLPL